MEGKKDYSESYSEASFFDKVKKFFNAAGRELIEKLFILYHTLQAPGTPVWAKTAIIAALGYFISPVDVIPDVIPVVGFTDDFGVVGGAITLVTAYITPEIQEKAKESTDALFS